MRSSIYLIPVVAILLSHDALVAQSQSAASDLAEASAVKIGELNEAYVTAFNKRNAKEIADCFRPNAEFTLLTGNTVAGRQKVAAAHQSFFTAYPEAKISGKQETCRFLRPGVAIATGSWQVKHGPSEYPAEGKWSTVITRAQGSWKYEAMRLMTPPTR